MLFRCLVLVVCCSFVAPVLTQSAPGTVASGSNAGAGYIKGRVLDATTNVALANITLGLSGENGRTIRRLSDSQGRFVFAGVSPGVYRLTASATGFIDGGYGTGRPGGQIGRLEKVSSVSPTVDIFLWPLSEIRGRITDELGEPIVNAMVNVDPIVITSSSAPPRSRTATTNDLGEYAFSDLDPGAYVVRTRAERVFATLDGERRDGGAAAPAESTWMRPGRFYGAADTLPHRIDLRAGEVREHVDVVVPIVRSVSISGRVDGSYDGNRAVVLLLPAEKTQSIQDIELARFNAQASGAFRFAMVAPGRYRLFAATLATTGGSGGAQFSESVIEVGSSPIGGIVLPVRPGPVIRGSVEIDVSATRGAASQANLVLEPAGPQTVSDSRLRTNLVLSTEGRFATAPMLPGTYRIRSQSAGGTRVVQWSREGSTPTACPITLTGDLNLAVVVSAGGTIEGTVTQDQSGPLDVLVFPADGRARSDVECDELAARRVQVNERGTFSITGLPAGRYAAVAVGADAAGSEWRTENRLWSLAASGGSPTTVVSGQTVSIRLSRRDP